MGTPSTPTNYVFKAYTSEANAINDTSALWVDDNAGSIGEVAGYQDDQYIVGFRKYWFRIEFNEPVSGFYIDWDDGEDNSPEKANSQTVIFEYPKTYGVVSHIFTKDGAQFPLIRAISTEGFYSKYYTSGDATNEYKALEENTATAKNEFSVVNVDVDSANNRIPYFYPTTLPPYGVLKVDRTEVFAGIDNSRIVETNDTIYAWWSEEADPPTANQVNSVEVTYLNKAGLIIIDTIDTDFSGANYYIDDVRKVLKVKLTGMKENDTNMLDKYERVYIRIKADAGFNETTDSVVCSVSQGAPEVSLEEGGNSVYCDASESRTRASNLSITADQTVNSFFFDEGKLAWTNIVANPALGTDIFDNTNITNNPTKSISYTFDPFTITKQKEQYDGTTKRFFDTSRLIRLQVKDNRTDDSKYSVNATNKSYIESFNDYRQVTTAGTNIPSEIEEYNTIFETDDNGTTWVDTSANNLLAATQIMTLKNQAITSGPKNYLLILNSERRFNKIFFELKNSFSSDASGAAGGKCNLSLQYFGVGGIIKPLKFEDTTNTTEDNTSLYKSGTITFDIPVDWEKQTAGDISWQTSLVTNAAWSWDAYGILVGIAYEGTEAADATPIVMTAIPYDNDHSQVIKVIDPMHLSLNAVVTAQSVSWRRDGRYTEITDRSGRSELRRLGAKGGSVRFGGVSFGDYLAASTNAGYNSAELVRNYQADGTPVYIDYQRPNGDYIRFYGKITSMSEDIPTGKVSQKWAVDMNVTAIAEYDGNGAWISDGLISLGGDLNEGKYL